MTKKILSIILLISTGLIACKKESTPQSKTTQEKFVGKWNLLSEVTNNYYSGSNHITTYPFTAGDYTEYRSDGKMIEYKNGSYDTFNYGFVSDSRIWILYIGNYFDIKTLTETDLQIYHKDEYSPTEYYESTLNLKK